MKNKYPKTTAILLGFFLIFIANKTAKLFLNQAKVEKAIMPNFVKEVYGENNVNDYLLVLQEQNKELDYKPFIEFSEKSRDGKFVNVSSQGIRCNSNNTHNCFFKGGKKEIWVFGGSTAFGYGVKDEETIPAYLEKLVKKKVINFGTGYYYSTNERILFQNLLQQYAPPYAAIFLDGYNDILYFKLPSRSAISDRIEQKVKKISSNQQLFNWLVSRVVRLNIYRLIEEKFIKKENDYSINSFYELATDDEISMAINRLSVNQTINSKVGESFDIKILNIIQPVAVMGEGIHKSNVPKNFIDLNSEMMVNLKKAYMEINNDSQIFSTNAKKNLLNLTFLVSDDPMYVDEAHYSPKFNKLIAYEIFKFIQLL